MKMCNKHYLICAKSKYITTDIELVALYNLWRRIVDVIMCLIILVPLKSLISSSTTAAMDHRLQIPKYRHSVM